MASNIALDDGVAPMYEELVRRKKHQAVHCTINDDFTKVSVLKTTPPVTGDFEDAWKIFISELPEDDCRFVLYDFSWMETATITKSKVILILWSAESAKVRKKMIYASSQEVLLNNMPDVQRQIQACDLDDLEFKTIKEKCIV